MESESVKMNRFRTTVAQQAQQLNEQQIKIKELIDKVAFRDKSINDLKVQISEQDETNEGLSRQLRLLQDSRDEEISKHKQDLIILQKNNTVIINDRDKSITKLQKNYQELLLELDTLKNKQKKSDPFSDLNTELWIKTGILEEDLKTSNLKVIEMTNMLNSYQKLSCEYKSEIENFQRKNLDQINTLNSRAKIIEDTNITIVRLNSFIDDLVVKNNQKINLLETMQSDSLRLQTKMLKLMLWAQQQKFACNAQLQGILEGSIILQENAGLEGIMDDLIEKIEKSETPSLDQKELKEELNEELKEEKVLAKDKQLKEGPDQLLPLELVDVNADKSISEPIQIVPLSQEPLKVDQPEPPKEEKPPVKTSWFWW